MKKKGKKIILIICLLLSLVIGTVVNAASVDFSTTTPTVGKKAVAEGEKVSGSVTYAVLETGNCEEAFGARVQADNSGWTTVTTSFAIYANQSGNLSYTLTPDADTPMRLQVWNTVGVYGGQNIMGTIDYK